MKWLDEIQVRYGSLCPKSKDEMEFNRLSPLERSYSMDMARLIDEVHAIHQRLEDFKFVLDKIPSHDLVQKIKSGKLKPEDKVGYA